MSSLRGIWKAVWGLVVEDGSLAVGIVIALAASWLAAALLAEPARDQVVEADLFHVGPYLTTFARYCIQARQVISSFRGDRSKT